jgi:hypothetical protein
MDIFSLKDSFFLLWKKIQLSLFNFWVKNEQNLKKTTFLYDKNVFLPIELKFMDVERFSFIPKKLIAKPSLRKLFIQKKIYSKKK